MDIIDDFIVRLQAPLFILTETFIEEPLTSKLEQFVRLLCSVDISKHIASPFSHRMGRRIMDRRCIARAFLAKLSSGTQPRICSLNICTLIAHCVFFVGLKFERASLVRPHSQELSETLLR